MSDYKFVTLEKFESETQAASVAAWLEADGIESFIDGAAASIALSYTGVAAAKLMVRDAQLQAARESLVEYRNQTAEPSEAWYCGHCKETNDGNFDLCWKCGQDQQDVAAEPPQSSNRPQTINESIEPFYEDNSTNPYQPARAKLESTDAYSVEQAEEAIHRAYRSAVLGLVMPLLFTPVSILLLLGSFDCSEAISAESCKLRRFAWALNLIVFVGWTAIVATVIFLLN